LLLCVFARNIIHAAPNLQDKIIELKLKSLINAILRVVSCNLW